jgi:hypothetical protein
MSVMSADLILSPSTDSDGLEATFEETVAAIRREKKCRHIYRVQHHDLQGPTLVCLFCDRERK